MSERLKTTNQVSNEEIIDDLTKDLKSSLSTEDDEEFVINPSSTAQEFPSASGDAAKATEVPKDPKGNSYVDIDETEYEKNADNDSVKDDDESDVDEEYLKDVEVDLTDDQKEERRIIAEELKNNGNVAFKDEEYERSIEKYTEGLKVCPLQFSRQRAILYCNRSAARMKLEKYELAIKDCNKAIELDDKYLKAYIRNTMARCRRRKMCRTRCRSRRGRFKRCRSCDRRYRVVQRRRRGACRRRRRRPGRRCGRPRYLWRCRSRSGSFKRCRHCDRRYRIRKRSCSY